MTRTNLRTRLYAALCSIGLLGAIAIVLYVVPGIGDERRDDLSTLGQLLFPLAVGVLAVLLAWWFQQRATFVESLRRLWSHLIEARVALNEYLVRTDVSEADYWAAFAKLSRAMDEVRGVYRNVGESETDVGFYPFQQLHDMRASFRELGSVNRDPVALKNAREEIDQAWESLRPVFLPEFEPPFPSRYELRDRTSDPRRRDPEGRILRADS